MRPEPCRRRSHWGTVDLGCDCGCGSAGGECDETAVDGVRIVRAVPFWTVYVERTLKRENGRYGDGDMV